MASHRVTYRRTNRRTNRNIQVRGYKEEGTITTPLCMTVLNDLDHLRLPQTTMRGST